MGSLHTVDIIVGLVVAASTLHAAFRGITREILSILTLLLAILVSVHCGAFAAGMLPHHQGAVKMAEIELKYGTDKRLRELAQDIIRAQNAEIAFMKRWLEKHSAAPAAHH